MFPPLSSGAQSSLESSQHRAWNQNTNWGSKESSSKRQYQKQLGVKFWTSNPGDKKAQEPFSVKCGGKCFVEPGTEVRLCNRVTWRCLEGAEVSQLGWLWKQRCPVPFEPDFRELSLENLPAPSAFCSTCIVVYSCLLIPLVQYE